MEADRSKCGDRCPTGRTLRRNDGMYPVRDGRRKSDRDGQLFDCPVERNALE